MNKMENWKIQINNGPIQDFQTKTTQYRLAVAAALAQLEFEESDDGEEIVKIWCERLTPGYGPYFYAHDGHSIYSVPKEFVNW